MLVCATLFWAGNFMVGKFASLTNIPPMSLVFFRWMVVWFILLPFTLKEIVKSGKTTEAKMHAMWTLEGLGVADKATVEADSEIGEVVMVAASVSGTGSATATSRVASPVSFTTNSSCSS
mgnify:CR=1 FL=1